MPELRAVSRWAPVFFLIVAGVAASRIPPFVPATAPNPETKPGLALQLPREGEVPGLLGVGAKPAAAEKARATAAANTKADYWFIAAYTLLFLSIALLHQRPVWRVGMIAVVLATAAFDLWENSVIEKFIADPAHAMSRDVWLPSQGKWFFFFVTALFIAALFLRGAKGWWVVAALLALPALAGVVAALTRNRVLLEGVLGPLMLALLVAVLLLPFALPKVPRSTAPGKQVSAVPPSKEPVAGSARVGNPLTRRFAPPSPEGEGWHLLSFSLVVRFSSLLPGEKVPEGRMRGSRKRLESRGEECVAPDTNLRELVLSL